MEDRRFPERAGNQGAERQSAHVGFGYGIGGHAVSKKKRWIQARERVQQGIRLRAGRGYHLDGDREILLEGL